jgi:hypothetical protein
MLPDAAGPPGQKSTWNIEAERLGLESENDPRQGCALRSGPEFGNPRAARDANGEWRYRHEPMTPDSQGLGFESLYHGIGDWPAQARMTRDERGRGTTVG